MKMDITVILIVLHYPVHACAEGEKQISLSVRKDLYTRIEYDITFLGRAKLLMDIS